MIGRSIHECVDLVLLGDAANTILESTKERLARAGGDLKIEEAASKCLESLDLASSAGDCSLDDVRTVKRELKIVVRDRRFELNPFD
jgi:hypothetical protein